MNGVDTLTLQEIVEDILIMNDTLTRYERKYSILSETFYESYRKGEEPEDSDWVGDWAIWAGTYKIQQRRIEQYRLIISKLRAKPQQLSIIIGKAARRESIQIAS